MPTLKETLSDAVKMAKRAPQFPYRVPLKNGLRIDVIYTDLDEQTEQIKIQLSRASVPPSLQEYKTVCANLPTPTNHPPDPRTINNLHRDGRIYLSAQITYPKPPTQFALIPAPGTHSESVYTGQHSQK